MTEEFGQYLRYINIGLGLTAFLWLLFRTTKRWEEYPREIGYLLTVLLGFVLALLVVSAERIVSHTPVTATLFVIFVVKSYLIFILWKTRTTKYRTGIRTARDSGQDQNRDLK